MRLSSQAPGGSSVAEDVLAGCAAGAHVVQFYERNDHVDDAVARFVTAGLGAGDAVVVIATERTRRALVSHLASGGHGVEGAARDGRLALLDARDMLAAVMVRSTPDGERFEATVGAAIATAAAATPHGRVRAYGEMVDLLWRGGRADAAARLEELWNDLLRRRSFSLMCAYAMGHFYSRRHGRRFQAICAAHTNVLPAEDYRERADRDARLLEIAVLQQRARALEDEVLRRRAAERVLREAERRKDEFLAMLGHELRNPLAAIATGVQLMRLRATGDDPGHEVIERQARHLVRLVDDLLDVSRITRGKVRLDRQPVEIAGVISRAVEMLLPVYEQRSHALSVDAPVQGLLVEADPVRLEQVFANLLSNAAKYTDRGGSVAVSARREGGQVVVSVRDSGIGIAPEVLPTVFELFVQGERVLDRSRGGLGIGLTLARSLVELHGGSISAHSAGPGTGSEFVVRLPAVELAGAARGVGGGLAGRRRGGASLRILVVDDNEDAADLLAEALRLFGHGVAVAYDGPRALALAPGFGPDVALLDIGLPDMDGFALAAKLREALPGRPPRLVAVTGYGQERDRARSRAAGFELHLVKPVDLDTIASLFAEMAPRRADASEDGVLPAGSLQH
jgi:signal transduction histidine kinase/ActR/RegA family two-component response regulator